MGYYIDPSQPPYSLKGDGSDETAGFQNFCNLLPNSCEVLWPTANAAGGFFIVGLSSMVDFYDKDAITISCLVPTDTRPQKQRGCGLAWLGTATTPPTAMFRANWVRKFTLANFSLELDYPGTVAPASTILIDEFTDPTRPKAVVTATTKNTIEGCTFSVPTTFPAAGGTHIALNIAPSSPNNVDFNTVRGSNFATANSKSLWGVGIQVGQVNSRENLFVDNGFSWSTNGIYLVNGGCYIDHCSFEGNNIDLRAAAYVNTLKMSRCRSENAVMAAQIWNGQGPFRVMDCSWGSVKGPYVMDIHNYLNEIGASDFGTAPPAGQPQTVMFNPAYGFGAGFRMNMHDCLPSKIIDNRSLCFQTFDSNEWRPY
jgi:hypothetical protein